MRHNLLTGWSVTIPKAPPNQRFRHRFSSFPIGKNNCRQPGVLIVAHQANIDAAKITIEACHCLARALRDQMAAVACENEQTKLMLDAAINTYKTVRLSLNLAELMSDCEKAYHPLRQLRLPKLRTFQNVQLKAEIQRLAQRMLDREE